MSRIEALAALLGLINVALVARRSMWNYPFGLAMVALYGWVFFDAKLYSDTILQGCFFAINLYGWWNWARAKGRSGEVRVEQLRPGARWAWLAVCVAGTAGWGWLMHRHTDAAYPWWDGAILILSLAAQTLQSRRNWESWLLWIAVDLLAVPLFAVRGLWITSGLYIVFLALCVGGLSDWLKARKAARA